MILDLSSNEQESVLVKNFRTPLSPLGVARGEGLGGKAMGASAAPWQRSDVAAPEEYFGGGEPG